VQQQREGEKEVLLQQVYKILNNISVKERKLELVRAGGRGESWW